MNNTGEAGFRWGDVSKQIAVVLVNQAPIWGPVVGTVLAELLRGQSEQLEQQKQIAEDIRKLNEGPYETGLLYLHDAIQVNNDNERREFIENAVNRFMDARGQEHDLLCRSQIEYYIGACRALLGQNELAGNYFQRAHATAIDHLREQERPALEAYEKYQLRKHEASSYTTNISKKALGGLAALGAFLGLVIFVGLGVYIMASVGLIIGSIVALVLAFVGIVVGGVTTLFLGLLGRFLVGAFRWQSRARQERAERAYRQAKERFEQETPRELYNFIQSLEQLQDGEAGQMLGLKLSPNSRAESPRSP